MMALENGRPDVVAGVDLGNSSGVQEVVGRTPAEVACHRVKAKSAMGVGLGLAGSHKEGSKEGMCQDVVSSERVGAGPTIVWG